MSLQLAGGACSWRVTDLLRDFRISGDHLGCSASSAGRGLQLKLPRVQRQRLEVGKCLGGQYVCGDEAQRGTLAALARLECQWQQAWSASWVRCC